MSDSSDLMERIRRGDAKALATFLMQCKDRIERRARGKLRAEGVSAVDAEDVFSSASRRLLLMCDDGRFGDMNRDDLRAYIVEAAMNVATDKVRADRTRRRTLQRLWRGSSHLSYEEDSEPDEETIESLLANLREDDRQLLGLRLRGMSHVQIANELGVPLSTERSRWQRVRARVKSRLAPPPRFTAAMS